MPKVHSHYENLKVERDASPTAIRVAYRTLTRRYHPDRNPGDADAARIMSTVNVAYETLSDPAKRRAHDEWIDQAERAHASAARKNGAAGAATARPHVSPFTAHVPAQPSDLPGASAPPRRPTRRALHVGLAAGLATLAVAAALIGKFALLGSAPALDVGAARAAAAASTQAPIFVRPAAAPNGRHWPDRSGYVDGYEVQNTGGQSDITIDNARNDADMFAKLMSLDGPQATPVRTFFVRAHSSFKLTGLPYGTYDLRYRNLSDGRLSRSQFFTLEEGPTTGGTHHSSMTLPLYKLRDAGLQAYGLSEAEF